MKTIIVNGLAITGSPEDLDKLSVIIAKASISFFNDSHKESLEFMAAYLKEMGEYSFDLFMNMEAGLR